LELIFYLFQRLLNIEHEREIASFLLESTKCVKGNKSVMKAKKRDPEAKRPASHFQIPAGNAGTSSPGFAKRVKGFDAGVFLATSGIGRSVVPYDKGSTVFSQGDDANSVYYIQKGKVKMAVISSQGKEATVAIMGAGDFVGEDCVASSHRLRLLTATAMSESVLLKIEKPGTNVIRSVCGFSSGEECASSGRPYRPTVQLQRKASRPSAVTPSAVRKRWAR
jgi:hypothetical protein